MLTTATILKILFASPLQFNITKLQLLEAEKAKVRREFERRENAIEVKKKVDYSKQLNESRIKVLQARENAVRSILSEAQRRLLALSKDPARYQVLLRGLLIEAAEKLNERHVKVRCRREDMELVRKTLSDAAKAIAARGDASAPPTIEIDEAHPLPPGPTPGQEGHEEYDTCAGGVVVTSADGRIVCSNTLDARLKIGYAANLPVLRELLFGAAES